MRLKYLELQGYKTFASRTQFSFDAGITAIVGPNGSGKSNIADAIRWVLGEQSYRSLRGKRTEDMIFSGSAQRARLGMASASLLLDNADGWLPIDFVEVTIARRAYRSGENEYLLNGRRVLLRDVIELLAKSGLARRTYTVVGQGLVDAVLSLRPEDRRALFEEAAGITLYQTKRAEALSRLEETRANLLRVNDIINEIAPRLERLERQAERAERHEMLSQQLEGLLRTWYGFRWRQEKQSLLRSRDALSRREERLERRRNDLEEFDQQMVGLRSRQYLLRERLSGWHRESADLHRQMEELQRGLAVWQERSRLLARQHDELQAELMELETQAQAMAERISAGEQEVAERQLSLQDKETLVAEAQAELDVHESQREALSRQVAQAQAQSFDLATQLADLRNRLSQAEERRTVLEQERITHRQAIVTQQTRAGELLKQGQAITSEQSRLQAKVNAVEHEMSSLDAALAESQTRQSELRRALADAQNAVEHLEARYDLLTRLRDEGEGLREGARVVLAASRRTQRGQARVERESRGPEGDLPILSGVIGTVAQLLRVPQEYEVSIEVALGGHLQDLVVESWPDAETAIAFLREGTRGRATFLPLDTVRSMSRLDVPRDKGVIGLGADLVEADERLAAVVEMLLGRTVVVGDLEAARRVFERLQGGFQIVTLAGEVLRSSGSVTGGQGRGQAHGQVLAREREWRELPAQLETAEGHGREVDAALAEAYTHERGLRERRNKLSAHLRELERAVASARTRSHELEREAEQITQQISWRRGLLAQVDEQVQQLDATTKELNAELEQSTARSQAAETYVSDLQANLDRLHGESLYQRLSEARTASAVARGALEHRRATLENLREGRVQLQSQVEAKRERIASLEKEQEALVEQIGVQTSQEAVIQGWLSALSQKIEPTEKEMESLDGEREQLENEEATLRARLRQAESSHSQAVLARSRQEDRLERLRRQIVEDFGLVDIEPTEGLPEQPPLPLGELVSTLPMVENLPDGLEEEMHQIKAQMRRMGSVNPNAPEEYAEALDRYTFLTSQAGDLDEAARSLRQVIAELDEVMRVEFETTFKKVSAHFRENFTRLFGGGTARLVLTEPDDLSSTGVEIIARPPGKRQQTLALLSGGERSLTAVALIFALLQVSPPPFCILDEVDAMLDEANVSRFREGLKSLSEHTQFIVITHNRGTIEAADTIYGISMGEDSVSQVVSLRLNGDRLATDNGATVEIDDV